MDQGNLHLNLKLRFTRAIRPLRALYLRVKGMVRSLLRAKPSVSFPDGSSPGSAFRKDPLARFLRQSVAIGVALLILTSFTPGTLLEAGASSLLSNDGDGTDFLDQSPDGDVFVNDDMYLLKSESVKITKDENAYVGLNEILKYTVERGDTLSTVAERHGVDVVTILDANGLSENRPLQIGQTLVIPPLSGVFHTVASGETVNGIAKKYSVDASVITAQNNVDVLQKGQKIFIPGAKPLPKPAPVIARTSSRQGSSSRLVTDTFETRPPTVVASGDGSAYIWPTNGSMTRGFSAGHYGWDIASRAKPDVWASGPGTVVKTEGGCPSREDGPYLNCNGGYGNNVYIKHADGWETHYAHLEKIYVEPGQVVEQGQVIGKMGNTGRVYGPTGIHLHFEAITPEGKKVSPGNLPGL